MTLIFTMAVVWKRPAILLYYRPGHDCVLSEVQRGLPRNWGPTGHWGKGRYYAVNYPVRDSIGNESNEAIFTPVMTKVMGMFQPSAVVLQCGSASIW